jgi:hypothetical protein
VSYFGNRRVYSGIGVVESCHSFSHTMGALNATHFAPLNREMFTYYHRRAKEHMRTCAKLNPLIEEFYGRFNVPWNDSERPFSIHETEAHECERQAFMYEMIAQHFLQDAWSTGHMFKRWGFANFEDFPKDVLLPGEAEYPLHELNNGPARRAGMALTLAALAGTFHGAKAKVYPEARQRLGAAVGDFLEAHGYLDDPLSGPFFTLAKPFAEGEQRTSWISGGLVFAGAGDMFWNPAGAHGSVLGDTIYDQQRTTLLACAGGSMRDVYSTPGAEGLQVTRAHGEPDEPLAPLLDPLSDACWDHWATNRSMLGALGPVNLLKLLYAQDGELKDVPIVALLMGIANAVVIDNRGGATPNFPQGDPDPAAPDNEMRLFGDRDEFLSRLQTRAALDFIDIGATYLENAIISPDGNRSAQGQDADGHPITLLGMAAPESATPPPAIPDVRYVDPPNNTLGMARQVFWRGDLENVCRESAANGGATLWNLRSKCIAGASVGGDPDSCTACVDLAELHIPTCLRLSPAETFHSKCSVLGVESIDSPPAGLPPWWFQWQERAGAFSPIDCGYQSYFVALRWCAGSAGYQDNGALQTEEVLNVEGEGSGSCDAEQPEITKRIGFATMDFTSTGETRPFMRPMVDALVYKLTWKLAPDEPCMPRPRYSLDARVAAAVAPAKFWDNESWGEREVDGGYFQLATPQCGTVQRASMWNRDCITALGQLGSNQNLAVSWNPATGEGISDFGQSDACLVREPRRLQAGCPENMACTASGQCVPAGFVPPTRLVLLE